MTGIVGRFMSSFGLTAAAAIAVSLIVSFTLTPMLAARWIKPHKEDRTGRSSATPNSLAKPKNTAVTKCCAARNRTRHP